jgi:hypothetical protein
VASYLQTLLSVSHLSVVILHLITFTLIWWPAGMQLSTCTLPHLVNVVCERPMNWMGLCRRCQVWYAGRHTRTVAGANCLYDVITPTCGPLWSAPFIGGCDTLPRDMAFTYWHEHQRAVWTCRCSVAGFVFVAQMSRSVREQAQFRKWVRRVDRGRTPAPTQPEY